MQRDFDRVLGAAVCVARRGDLNVIAREEMDCDLANILPCIIRHRGRFAMFPFLCICFGSPFQILLPVRKARKAFRARHSGFPFHLYVHFWMPYFRNNKTAPTPSTLISTNDVDSRMPIHTKVIDRPVGMIDAFDSACLSICEEQKRSESSKHNLIGS